MDGLLFGERASRRMKRDACHVGVLSKAMDALRLRRAQKRPNGRASAQKRP